MRADVLIVGQGLAGTLIAWELERAGLAFEIVDRGHAGAASNVAAGIINPITGRRLVKSWRVEELLPLARKAYSEIESELGISLWRELRVRRLFADDVERRAWAEKQSRGELLPFASAPDDGGFWIEGAARVDLAALLAAARRRWKASGRLREAVASIGEDAESYGLVIDCRGQAATHEPGFAFVPWEFSKGETLEIAVEGLAPDVVLNRRQWILPLASGSALVGATHERGITDAHPTAEARANLEAHARELLRRPFAVTAHRAGVRVNLPDKHPVAGRHPEKVRLGICNGLGAKGALLAPWLARQWSEHVVSGAAFDPAIEVKRFARE